MINTVRKLRHQIKAGIIQYKKKSILVDKIRKLKQRAIMYKLKNSLDRSNNLADYINFDSSQNNSDKIIDANRELLYKFILQDTDLEKIEVQYTAKQIVENFVKTHTLDFLFLEIGSFILNCGHAAYARKYFEKSLEINNKPSTYSLYLQCLLLDNACDEQELYQKALRFNDYFSNVQRYQSYDNSLITNRKLNIGYVCHFFFNSVSQSLLVPFLKAHHRDRINVFCYSDADPEVVTDNTKQVADYWRDTKNMSDHELAEKIREDKIDILLELNGHIIVNRYGVVARKPAPIQINYYNQSASAGLETLDYVLIGEGIEIDQSAYVETVYRLEGVQGVSIFPEYFPDVSPAPCLSRDYIVFGSFGAAHKVNHEVVKLWSRVLKAVPNSMLYMKAGVLTFDAYLNVYKKMFRDEGIDIQRIRFEGFSDHKVMLDGYAEVDIALDTFPHNAGTTTMESLWQGVPVITLNGSRYSNQNGRIVLTCIGHPELVSYSHDEYVEKAVALANNKEKLIHYRNTLRDDFKRSQLANPDSFATRLENAYHDMWADYCSRMTMNKQ